MKESIRNWENLCCIVCLEQFSTRSEKYPKCLECGHSLCQSCFSEIEQNSKKCPQCNTQFSEVPKIIDNHIIIKAITLINDLQIDIRPFCRLSFWYCKTCAIFLTNFTKKIHLFYKHTVMSISEYNQLFYELIIKKVNTTNVGENIALYLICYLFQNPDIFKKKNFSIKENIYLKSFSFYGEKVVNEGNENGIYNYYNSVLKNISKLNEESETVLRKGILIGKTINFILQGYSLFDKEGKTLYASVGAANIDDSIFFGCIRYTEGENIYFNSGVYYDRESFYVGMFNSIYYPYPMYELEKGEKITIDVEGTKVIRKNDEETKNETINSNDFLETFESNYKYSFLLKEGLLEIDEMYKDPKMIFNFSKINDSFLSCDIHLTDTIEQRKVKISIENLRPRRPYSNLRIGDCRLILNFTGTDCSLEFCEQENKIKILPIYRTPETEGPIKRSKTKIEMLQGKVSKLKKNYFYIIEQKPTDTNDIINTLKQIKLQTLYKNLKVFLKELKRLFSYGVKDFNAYFTNSQDATLNKSGIDMIHIDSEEKVITFSSKNLKHPKTLMIEEIQNMSISDFLPDIFDERFLDGKKHLEIMKSFDKMNQDKTRCSICGIQ